MRKKASSLSNLSSMPLYLQSVCLHTTSVPLCPQRLFEGDDAESVRNFNLLTSVPLYLHTVCLYTPTERLSI
jgi:hypothetical protein